MEINKMGNTQGITPVNTTSTTSAGNTNRSGTINFGSDSTQAGFKAALSQSPLDDRIPNQATLNKLGFNVPFNNPIMTGGKDQPYLLDMNGGETYQNKNGDTIRISDFEHSVTYKTKDGKISHNIFFDPDGNPLKGTLQTKNADGSVTQYQFEYDVNGNPKLTDSRTSYLN